jgi:excisionase family DNA binding protein
VPDDAKRKPYLTPNEVAELLLVSPITVRQWAQKGLLPARVTAGGHRRFRRETVEAFARRMGIAETGDPAEGMRVLVVDDDRQLNGFLVELLRTRGGNVEVASAYDGFEAGRLVPTFRPHVVLLDLMMPGLDGFEVCRRLKGDVSTLHIRVIAMTGHYAAETAQRILAAGADRFLKKPFESRELLEACGLLDRVPAA